MSDGGDRWYSLRPRTPEELDILAFRAFKAWCQPDTKEKDAREVWAAMHSESREPWRRVVNSLIGAGA